MHKERKMFLIATWFYLRKKNVFVKERVHYYLKIIRIRSYFDFDSLIKSREMIYSPALNMQHGLSTFHRMNRVLEWKWFRRSHSPILSKKNHYRSAWN